MNVNIKGAILKYLATSCDNQPDKDIEKVWNTCKRELISDGVPNNILDEIDFFRDIEPHFHQKLLPNPGYWFKQFKSYFTFFFINAKSGEYRYLFKTLEDSTPDSTYYASYGENDVIIRFLGNEKMAKTFESILSNSGFQSVEIKTNDILLFYGKNIPINFNYRKPEIEPDMVDNLLSDNLRNISEESIDELIDSGVILNRVVFEDTHITGRLRAYIGIKIHRLPPSQKLLRIGETICEINDKEYLRRKSRPISSVYKCDNPYYAYFIEGIFDDQEQLDYVTDMIQDIESIGDTETIILARANIVPLSYSKKLIGELTQIAIMDPLQNEVLLPLSQSLIEIFPNLENIFLNAPSNRQFKTISIFADLIEKNSSIDFNNYQFLMDYLYEYFEGILNWKFKTIQNAGIGYLRDVVEDNHRKFSKLIIDKVFQGDVNFAQKELKAPNINWERWSLYQWGRFYYDNWNKQKLYKSILEIPAFILSDLEFLGSARNSFAHASEKKDINQIISIVRDVFLRSFRLLSWIEKEDSTISNPNISINNFRDLINNIKPSHYEILSQIELNQEELSNAITILQNESLSQYNDLKTYLLLLNEGKINLNDETFSKIETLLLPIIEKENQKNVENYLGYLEESSKKLPSEFIIELLVSICLAFLNNKLKLW